MPSLIFQDEIYIRWSCSDIWHWWKDANVDNCFVVESFYTLVGNDSDLVVIVDDWHVGLQDFIKDQVSQLYMWPKTLEIPVIDDPR
jgi:hypothetical protein